MIVKSDVLPDWTFVGGGFQSYEFILRNEEGSYYDLPDATVNLAIADYLDPSHLVFQLDTTTTKLQGTDCSCRALFTLSPTNTVNMSGRYIYQITVESSDGIVAPPLRGRMFVTKNINPMV